MVTIICILSLLLERNQNTYMLCAHLHTDIGTPYVRYITSYNVACFIMNVHNMICSYYFHMIDLPSKYAYITLYTNHLYLLWCWYLSRGPWRILSGDIFVAHHCVAIFLAFSFLLLHLSWLQSFCVCNGNRLSHQRCIILVPRDDNISLSYIVWYFRGSNQPPLCAHVNYPPLSPVTAHHTSCNAPTQPLSITSIMNQGTHTIRYYLFLLHL